MVLIALTITGWVANSILDGYQRLLENIWLILSDDVIG